VLAALSNGPPAFGLAVDATSLYWANGTAVVRLTPK
jgi:hypothetical protein